MFGFLFKVLLMAVLVAFIGGYLVIKRGSLPEIPKDFSQFTSLLNLPALPAILGVFKNLDTAVAGQRISDSLDSLVTHPDRNSPVVLGVKVTNDSLSTLTDVLMKLPTDQLQQIQNAVCASPSAR